MFFATTQIIYEAVTIKLRSVCWSARPVVAGRVQIYGFSALICSSRAWSLDSFPSVLLLPLLLRTSLRAATSGTSRFVVAAILNTPRACARARGLVAVYLVVIKRTISSNLRRYAPAGPMRDGGTSRN